PLHRIAQERRHVVGEARAAAFRLALVRTLRALLTLTARLRRLGVGVPVTRMLALSAVRPLGGSLRRPCSTRLLAMLVTGLLAVFRTLLATRLSALLGTCLRSRLWARFWARLWPRLAPLAGTWTTTTALAMAGLVVAACLSGGAATAATAPTLRAGTTAATATLLACCGEVFIRRGLTEPRDRLAEHLLDVLQRFELFGGYQ